MEARFDYRGHASGGYAGMLSVEKYLSQCGLEPSLLHMIKLRASQLNGCAFCLDMHWKDAKALGESDQRLYSLDAWDETPFYTDRERAALQWTEAVTRVSETHVPDAAYELVRSQFNEKEVADLTLAIAMINSWNRLCIAARVIPGTYRPANAHASLPQSAVK